MLNIIMETKPVRDEDARVAVSATDSLGEAPSHVSSEEWALRCDLAAAYRLAAIFGWVDILGNHFTVRLPPQPGAPDVFLINPFGMMFEEITASSLVKIDIEGNVLGDTEYPINRAGFVLHSALHLYRPDAGCIMHLHTDAGVAVASLEDGILPLNQLAIGMSANTAIHEYEGPVVDMAERETLVRDLGDADRMLLRNHGTLTLGRSVAEAFINMYAMENVCRWQVQTLAMGLPWKRPAQSVIDEMLRHNTNSGRGDFAERIVWPSLLRKVERRCPDYKN